ncbi:hypothetical protein [Actinopolyspora mortivallis]|uniref:hypothetical protein n=1 Tax=Actinopolyspora mortivallis TaxID=33906 RepID=UPI0015E6014F|nr:hypothetical protein [Actinopolyspora mortivallis]
MRRNPPQGVFAVFPVGAFVVALIIDAWTWFVWTTGTFAVATVILEIIRARTTERDQ